MKEFSFLDFVREVGKHITVNYMMAKDSVKRRLNGEARDGLSFTEFTYQACFKATTSFICMKPRVVNFRWEAPTSGEISLPERN